MILNGCGESTGNPGLKVEITNECEKNAATVSAPANKIGDDARIVAARYAAKLKLANTRLTTRSKCEADIRERYANAK